MLYYVVFARTKRPEGDVTRAQAEAFGMLEKENRRLLSIMVTDKRTDRKRHLTRRERFAHLRNKYADILERQEGREGLDEPCALPEPARELMDMNAGNDRLP